MLYSCFVPGLWLYYVCGFILLVVSAARFVAYNPSFSLYRFSLHHWILLFCSILVVSLFCSFPLIQVCVVSFLYRMSHGDGGAGNGRN
jgi:hypothetical protein